VAFVDVPRPQEKREKPIGESVKHKSAEKGKEEITRKKNPPDPYQIQGSRRTIIAPKNHLPPSEQGPKKKAAKEA